MARLLLAVAIVIVASFPALVAGSDPNVLLANLKKHVSTAAGRSIGNAAVAAIDSKGFRFDASMATGSLAGDDKMPMLIDSAIRGNAFSEMLLAAVTQRLIERSILPQADEAVWRTLLPKGASFTNPLFLGTSVTLRQLMTHTSSLVDTDRLLQVPFFVSPGNSVSDIRVFAEDYFLVTVGGNSAVTSSVWGSSQPGLASSYRYARSNIALLGFIVQQAITLTPSLVSGQVKTVGALIQELITAPLGMTSTYFLLPDGSSPVVQTSLSQLRGRRVPDPSPQSIHAAYVADFMLITSATDMLRAMYALVVSDSSTWKNTGTAMRGAFIDVPKSTARPWLLRQGFGFQAFDVAFMCAEWEKTLATPGSACPLSIRKEVFGFVSVGSVSTVAVVCTGNPTVTGIVVTSTTCVSVVQSISLLATTAPTATQALALATEVFRQAFSTEADSASSSIIRPLDQRQSALYGFSVFVGVFALIVVVFLSTYILEFVVRPCPVAGNLVNDAYPQLDLSAVDEIYEQQEQSGFW